MTISIAWVRREGTTAELIMASDSRLSGGGHIDHCQKVYSLPREDCGIAFCGSTLITYPFISQLINSIVEYKKVFDRAVDFVHFRGRVVALLNRFISHHEDIDRSELVDDLRDTSFLFCGWSWRLNDFQIAQIYFDHKIHRFVSRESGYWKILGLARDDAVEINMIGDYRSEFNQRLCQQLGPKIAAYKAGENTNLVLNYEPLQVLSEMLRDPAFTDRRSGLRGLIGGAPQVMKIYPFMRTLNYAVEWQVGDRKVMAMKGRQLGGFERVTAQIIDPLTGQTRSPTSSDQ